MLFDIGDYLAGAIVGAVTAAAVRMVVWPGMDMVIAMLIGTGLGMVVHVIVGFLLGPMIGMFNAMIPASLIGMYGGMFFGMRDSMAAGSRTVGAALVPAIPPRVDLRQPVDGALTLQRLISGVCQSIRHQRCISSSLLMS